MIGTTGRWLVPRLLPAVGRRHPGVRAALLEGNTTTLQLQLESGRLDMSLTTLPLAVADLETEPLFEEDLLLIAPSDHPLSRRERIAFADLADVELLLTPPTTSIRRELDAAAERAGFALRPKHEMDGVRLLASLAFEGLGPAIVPASAAPDWLSGPWRRVEVENLEPRLVGLAHRRRGLLSAPARALREVLVEVVAAGGPRGIRPLVGGNPAVTRRVATA
jgi:DNA-binding transcriptional LysR family regulator